MDFVKDDNKRNEKAKNLQLLRDNKGKGKDSFLSYDEDNMAMSEGPSGIISQPTGLGG